PISHPSNFSRIRGRIEPPGGRSRHLSNWFILFRDRESGNCRAPKTWQHSRCCVNEEGREDWKISFSLSVRDRHCSVWITIEKLRRGKRRHRFLHHHHRQQALDRKNTHACLQEIHLPLGKAAFVLHELLSR